MMRRCLFCLLIVAVMIVVGLAFTHVAYANPILTPPCGVFADPNCFFSETFENSTGGGGVCFSGWACSNPGATSLVTGLTGSTKAADLHYVAPIGSDYGNFSDTGMNFPATNGRVFWAEVRIRWSANYRWYPGTVNKNVKQFEWEAGTPTPGCQNRILLTLYGTGGFPYDGVSSYDSATPSWWFGPNQFESPGPGAPPNCPNANPFAPGTRQQGQFALPEDSIGPFVFRPDIEYHLVMEFKSADNHQGYFKMWVNDVLITSVSQLNTCEGGTCNWTTVRFGGAGSGTAPGGQEAIFDNIRLTTTNIAPGGGSALNPPSGTRVCKGAGCTPAMLLPLPALIGAALWLRRKAKGR